MPYDEKGSIYVPGSEPESGDAAKLREIRAEYTRFRDYWRDKYEDGDIDMRFIAGDPWDPEDKENRKNTGRPAINHDELGQYVNEAINGVRQNPRGIKVEPAGDGADDQTAEDNQDLVRGIEYRSSAQRLAYLPAYENALQRGYGFYRISRRFVYHDARAAEKAAREGKDPFIQEVRIKGIPNPNSVLYDPDSKEPDGSDCTKCFVLDPVPLAEFKRRYPKAQKCDFSAEDRGTAPDWINDKTVLVAEYWCIETSGSITIYQLETGEIVLQEPPKGVAVKRKRTVDRQVPVQYITNGVEILERTEQPPPYIPIVPVWGKRLWLTEGGQAKLKLISLVRLARDPQMSYAYLCSQEMEEAGMTPKTPFVGAKGQFESDQEAWELLNKVPRAYVQYDVITDQSNGSPLPPPSRPQFIPNFQSYEIAKDSARRAIQAAMGTSPLPTAAQRNNEKSGVALQRIQQQRATGNFHFSDNLDGALEYGGKIILSWIGPTYDTPRDVVLRKADESLKTVVANQAYQDPKTGEQRIFDTSKGSHDVTISTSPSFESQREEAGEFLDTLVQNLPNLPIAPPAAAKLVSMAVRMKGLGAQGDQMADIIDPEPKDGQALPPQAQAAIAQAQQQMQALQAVLQELQAKLAAAEQKLTAKAEENATKLAIAEAQAALEKFKAELQAEVEKYKADLAAKVEMAKLHETLASKENIEEAKIRHAGEMHDTDMEHAEHMAERERDSSDAGE